MTNETFTRKLETFVRTIVRSMHEDASNGDILRRGEARAAFIEALDELLPAQRVVARADDGMPPGVMHLSVAEQLRALNEFRATYDK